MRRMSIAIAVATFLLGSFVSAQQATNTGKTDSKQSNASSLPSGPILGGMGTKNYIPIWASPTFLLNSAIYQTSGSIGIGTTSPVATLDVNGNINAAMAYAIGGNNVISLGRDETHNLFLGVGAGTNNTYGYNNAFSGYMAGNNNSDGNENTFYGAFSGYSNTAGPNNTFLGGSAGYSNTTGSSNTFSGNYAGGSNTNGNGNTFSGFEAGEFNTTGGFNTFYGTFAGYYNATGSNNVYIANLGSTSGESNVIRIGTQGTGQGQQSTAYIAGIYGVNVSGVPVQINSNGQLGAAASSARFKEQVHDMGDSSTALMNLRPVTFFYKPEYSDGERTLQYGLIAEEVANVYPELVAHDNDGKPYAVRYQYLSTMLLNEVQKQYRRAEQQSELVSHQQAQIEAQQREIKDLKRQLQLKNTSLEERLSRLEKQRGTQAQVIAQQ